MPMISLATMIGTWNAKSVIRSNSPLPAAASSSASITAWMRGPRSSILRLENADTTRARMRVWSGASIWLNDCASVRLSPCSVLDCAPAVLAWASGLAPPQPAAMLENLTGSFSTVAQSS
jgi:hypothetical protein